MCNVGVSGSWIRNLGRTGKDLPTREASEVNHRCCSYSASGLTLYLRIGLYIRL